MAAIDTYLQQIRTAVYGREVRSAIANGIEECYAQAKGPDFDPSVLNAYAKREELAAYITTAEADGRYVSYDTYSDLETSFQDTLTSLGDYLTLRTAEDLYLSKGAAENYLTKTAASSTYALKTDLSDMVVTAQLEAYLLKSDASDVYLTKEDARNTYMAAADMGAFADLPYLAANYVSKSDMEAFHSFEYIVCDNVSAKIPSGIQNVYGSVGSLSASADTMHAIYLVATSNTTGNRYSEYVTVRTGEGVYAWECIGGNAKAIIDDNDNPGGGDDIDLSSYITYAEALDSFASKSDLNDYLPTVFAEENYVTKTYLSSELETLKAADGYVTKGEIGAYLKSAEAENIYVKKTEIQMCLKASDAEKIYATKTYVDTMSIAQPTGDNILLLLEVDNIPGARQTIYYNEDGSVSRIVHVRDNTNFRVDSFKIDETSITETRLLTTGQKLTITTDTNTMVTTTVYDAG